MTSSTDQHPKQATRRLGAAENDEDAVLARAVLTKVVVANVVLLTMIAPLATDMYVPAFPLVGSDLGATATEVQLTLTTYFVGMALGQLIGGPVSDQRGRRRPLLASLVVMMFASALCAFSPSIAGMMLARLVQGFSGGWAMVIARSLVVDLASGARLVKALNLMPMAWSTRPSSSIATQRLVKSASLPPYSSATSSPSRPSSSRG